MFMKKVLSFIVLCLIAISVMAQTKVNDYVEVMYFHGKQRCATCLAIEQHVREVVERNFAMEKKKDKVRFKVVDISTPDGGRLAKDYRVAWASLYISRWRNGKETRSDMTKFAFKNARMNTDVFKKGVKRKISELLK